MQYRLQPAASSVIIVHRSCAGGRLHEGSASATSVNWAAGRHAVIRIGEIIQSGKRINELIGIARCDQAMDVVEGGAGWAGKEGPGELPATAAGGAGEKDREQGGVVVDAVSRQVDALCGAYSERMRQVHSFLDNQEDSRERTARQTAAGRALWSHVIHDPLANVLAGESHMRRLEAKMQESRCRGARETAGVMLAVRTLWFDVKIEAALRCCRDELQAASSPSPLQVVFLGAGMDTRAYRLKCLEGCAVFEVDLPRILECKGALLDAAGAAEEEEEEGRQGRRLCAASVARVAADLASEEWWEKLEAAGFRARPCVWVLEGLLYYLREEEAMAVLRRISSSCPPGTWLLADFMNEFSTHLAAELQTPFYFHSDWPEELLPSLGYVQVQVSQVGDPDANFGLIADSPLGLFHRLRLTPRYSKSDADGNPCRRLYLVHCRVG